MHQIIFFNTGWMDSYAGNRHNEDPITGGGAHNREEGWGGEIFNFKPYRGKYYGFVRTTHSGEIKLERLGAAKSDHKIDNVTVVWTAARPIDEGGGTYVVGWYKNATIFRSEQSRPRQARHSWQGNPIGYQAEAPGDGVVLLTRDARLLPVPRGKGAMGQSNVWYALDNLDFVNQVIEYIASDGLLPPKGKVKGKRPTQADPLVRLEVEKKAVEITWAYYKSLDYELNTVERDKVGWDLTATNGKIKLKLEVKGLSGPAVAAELTANEYKNLLIDRPNYRVCIVTNALTKPKLHIFSYSRTTDRWESEEGLPLVFEEVVSARVFSR
ncbi:DUF3883 domain-containing protein [Hymenobacter setariae]|uniref:DUF3883 domain-containing protein n=1 Tax=Hymenobacter setariae TaxID=2594794 RepID=A0A558BJV2_9BACT|nr:DUF3883 domain-containing protein [Hymenobacter setariae]TVT36802.1 DUF3883 domain-containing protein [Hymenobacter setariae]